MTTSFIILTSLIFVLSFTVKQQVLIVVMSLMMSHFEKYAFLHHFLVSKLLRHHSLACLHDQNKSGFFGGPAFILPIRTIWKVFKKQTLIGWKKPVVQKCHFCFDHVNRLHKWYIIHQKIFQDKKFLPKGVSRGGRVPPPPPPIEMMFQVYRLNFSWDMPKMHYFSNKFSKIAKRWELSAPAPLNLRFWWPEVTWCGHIVFFKLTITKSNFKKSVMTSF